MVAGRKEQSSKRKAVTATTSNVEPKPPTIKKAGSAASPAGTKTSAMIDFAVLREQVTMEQALTQLGHLEALRGNATQRRGPCPIHGSSSPTSRSFSVNLERNVFRCFSPACQAQGNVLDFWAAMHHLTLHEAARSMADQFGIQIPTK